VIALVTRPVPPTVERHGQLVELGERSFWPAELSVIVLPPVSTEHEPPLTVTILVIFGLGFGFGFFFLALAATAAVELPWVVTWEVAVIGPEHVWPDAQPVQVNVSAAVGPDIEIDDNEAEGGGGGGGGVAVVNGRRC
jgi:hypothetical protein